MGSPSNAGSVEVLLDGHPLPQSSSGSDVHGGVATVGADRLYRLVELPNVQTHTLTIEAAPGVSVYDFTFG